MSVSSPSRPFVPLVCLESRFLPVMRYVACTDFGFFAFWLEWNSYSILILGLDVCEVVCRMYVLLCDVDVHLKRSTEEPVGDLAGVSFCEPIYLLRMAYWSTVIEDPGGQILLVGIRHRDCGEIERWCAVLRWC